MKLLYPLILLLLSCSTEPEDCAGVAGGSAEEDMCGVCDSDATNDHGKKSNVVKKIKEAAKPAITKQQIAQAKDYIAAGGTIEAIETKYKLTNEQRKDITATL